MHCHESSASLPASIAFGMAGVLWRNHDIPKGGFCPCHEVTADLQCARRWRCPNQKSAVLANRSDHIASCRRVDEQVRRYLSHINDGLRKEWDVHRKRKRQCDERVDATASVKD